MINNESGSEEPKTISVEPVGNGVLITEHTNVVTHEKFVFTDKQKCKKFLSKWINENSF